MKEIKLNNSDKVALVDDEDFDLVNRHHWHLNIRESGIEYAANSVITMHRMIIGSPNFDDLYKKLTIDHKDRNALNNQKSNLRWATKAQNGCNARKKVAEASSQYKGVYFNKQNQRWCCECRIGDVRKCKSFKTEFEAAHGYDQLALEMHGEFAYLNFPNC